MAVSIRQFTGNLDLDNHYSRIDAGDYTGALNITRSSQTGRKDGVVVPIIGNRQVPYDGYKEGTINKVIGKYADKVRNRIIYFVWNNEGYHNILEFDKSTRSITKIFESRTDSDDVDILNLQLNYKVNSIDIIHRDEEGDLLLWNDAYNRPGQINIVDFKSGLYGTSVSEDMIRLARIPPLDEPLTIYESDTTVKVNNLKKKLFQFAYAWGYKNGEISTLSPISKVSLPINAYTTSVDSNPSNNNVISIKIVGGPQDYKYIKIFGRESLGVTYSDWFVVDTLDRDDYEIDPGTTFNYKFYNDGQYITADQNYTDLLWDYASDKCNAQKVVNGNVIVQGGILSGYDKISRDDISVNLSSDSIETQSNDSVPSNPTISYTVYNTFIDFIIGNSVNVGDFFRIKFNFSGVEVNPSPIPIGPFLVDVSYTAVTGDTPSSVANYFVAQIQAQASAQYAGVETNHNNNPRSVAFQTTGTVARKYTNVIALAEPPLRQLGGNATWKWNEKIRFGLVYVDKYGKSNGVVSFVTTEQDLTDFSVTMPDFSIGDNGNPEIPIVNALINHIPPEWAESFYWVRTTNQSVSYFIQYITAETDTDGNYHYFCIENLTVFKDKNTGFVPSYTFQSGDRLRVYAEVGDNGYTLPSSIKDYEILGTVKMNMTGGSTEGLFLKVKKSSSGDTYGERIMIEIYRPSVKTNNENEVFFAFGESYGIYTDVNTGIRYHLGEDQNQTASQPATFTFEDGDVYYKFRDFYELGDDGTIDPDSVYSKGIMDTNYNDFWDSAVNSNGAPWLIDSNAKRLFNPVEVRFSQAYQPGTNINGLNRFYPNNMDEYFRDYGAIMAFSIRDKMLHVFQRLKTGRVPIYGQILKDQSGTQNLIVSDQLLNPINYYAGDYGIGDAPESLVSNNFSDYFVDTVRGVICRLSQNGITPISIINNANNFAVREIGQRGFDSKIYGLFDAFSNLYIISMEATDTLSAKTLSFSEKSKGFESFMSFISEAMVDINQLVCTFKDGQLWTHDSNMSNNFYGVQYDSEIEVVFNDNQGLSKSFEYITEYADDTWDVPLMSTNIKSSGTGKQQSSLSEDDFKYEEGEISASIKRDINSNKGRINGDFMKGQYLIAKFRKKEAANFEFLNFVALSYIDSPKNPN